MVGVKELYGNVNKFYKLYILWKLHKKKEFLWVFFPHCREGYRGQESDYYLNTKVGYKFINAIIKSSLKNLSISFGLRSCFLNAERTVKP